jgi:hypothetical protein
MLRRSGVPGGSRGGDTEEARLVVTLYVVFGTFCLRIPALAFLISSRTNASIVPQLGHDRFLPDAFRFVSQPSSCPPTLCNVDTENAKKNNGDQNVVFWIVTPYSLVGGYRRFELPCPFHFQH